VPLKGIQVKIRVFEPDSRQIREITVVEDFLVGVVSRQWSLVICPLPQPRNTRTTRKMAEYGEQELQFARNAVVREW